MSFSKGRSFWTYPHADKGYLFLRVTQRVGYSGADSQDSKCCHLNLLTAGIIDGSVVNPEAELMNVLLRFLSIIFSSLT